jgi:hypothetical protein
MRREGEDIFKAWITAIVIIAIFIDVSVSQLQTLFFARGFFYPEDGGDTFLRNVSSYKTAFFIITAMKTSNPTCS